MGFLDRFSECFTFSALKKKVMPMQAVNIRVKMDCEGCENKIRNALEDLEGVDSVEVNRKQQRVTVKGEVDPKEVLEEVKNTGKKAEVWPYVPYNLVTYPYVPQAYDIKARVGFVRSVPQAIGDPKSPEMKLMVMFNDDNPNACSIM